MAEEFERFKRFEYRQNSNLVLQRDTSTGVAPAVHLGEPTGEPESLAGRRLYPMGDKVERGLRKEEKQRARQRATSTTAAATLRGKTKLRRNKLDIKKGATVLDTDVTESFFYKPTTQQTRLVYEQLLVAMQQQLGDQPVEVLKGAADEVLAALKVDNCRDSERKKNVEQVLGTLSSERYQLLHQLAKNITDYSMAGEEEDSAAGAGAAGGGLDSSSGVAVVFDEEEEGEDGFEGHEYAMEVEGEGEDDEEDEEDEEGSDVETEKVHLSARGMDDGGDEELLLQERDAYSLDIAKIDPHWLQRELNVVYGDPNKAVAAEKEILSVLATAADIQECENRLVLLLKYENFELAKKILKNRWKIFYAVRLGQAQSKEEKAAVYDEMKNTPEGQEVLELLESLSSRRNREKEIAINVRKEAASLAAKAQAQAASLRAAQLADQDDAGPLVAGGGGAAASGGRRGGTSTTTTTTTSSGSSTVLADQQQQQQHGSLSASSSLGGLEGKTTQKTKDLKSAHSSVDQKHEGNSSYSRHGGSTRDGSGDAEGGGGRGGGGDASTTTTTTARRRRSGSGRVTGRHGKEAEDGGNGGDVEKEEEDEDEEGGEGGEGGEKERRTRAIGGKGGGERGGEREALHGKDTTSRLMLLQPRRPTAAVDLAAVGFQQGGHFMANTRVRLPEGTQRIENKSYDEVIVQPLKRAEDILLDTALPAREQGGGIGVGGGAGLSSTLQQQQHYRMPVAAMPAWARPAFETAKIDTLNVIQTKVYKTAFEEFEENMLLCAPTGAGKTNVAMLAILNVIGRYRRPPKGEGQQHFSTAPAAGGATTSTSSTTSSSNGQGGLSGNSNSSSSTMTTSNDAAAAASAPGGGGVGGGVVPSTVGGNSSIGSIDINSFKIVYISPMKALVAEQVQAFSQRLQPYGIRVRELTGDVHLSRQQIEETQVIVCTPEKWDIVTRRAGERAYTQAVRLVILDEVHLLHDNRGPVLETIIARTIRQIETAQEHIRLIGLSATLPNYEDVAVCLRVRPEKGLFFFGNHYRPVPLKQTYIGIKDKKAVKRYNTMNEVTYEKVMETAGRSQVLVFVHSRKETVKTARSIRDSALQRDTLSRFLQHLAASREILQAEAEAVKSLELKELLPYGFAVHHAGLARTDRKLVEDLFADRHIQVLVSTATLAWGVNLPAHTVIVKGSQIYSPEKGAWTELSPLDVLQMLGRAGRPQYDKTGHAIFITQHSELQYYLSLNNQQLPIESQLLSTALPDVLNSEIVLGSVRSRDDAVAWLGYTYLYVRMLKNPQLYGVTVEDDEDYDSRHPFHQQEHANGGGGERKRKGGDPLLQQHCVNIVDTALKVLDRHGLIKYDRRGGAIQVTALGRVASHYYVKHATMATYNQHLRPLMSDIELLRLFSLSAEFKYLPVREEEKMELQRLMERVPIPVKGAPDETSSKVNVLLQAYISKLKLEGLTMAADMVYVQQSASRIMRALFEICLRRGWAMLAMRALQFAKEIDRRMWSSMSPLRQFKVLPEELLRKLEKKDLAFERYYDLTAAEIGELVRVPQMGKLLHRLIHLFPKLEMAAFVQPLTRTCLLVELTLTPDFQWDSKIHGTGELFWIIVEDVDGELILHHEIFILPPFTGDVEHTLCFTLPITDPLPPNYHIRVVSDRWLQAQASLPISFKNLILPDRAPPHTELLDLQPLPVTAFRDPKCEKLYTSSFKTFNPIQTQVFSTLFTTNENVLLCLPATSGKEVCLEFALLRLFKTESPADWKAVYIAPHPAVVRERYDEWKEKLGKGLGVKVSQLTGEMQPDIKILEQSHLVLTTPEKWDFISRRWKTRKVLQATRLLLVDDLHVLNSAVGSTLEVCLSRTRYISAQLQRPIRLVAVANSLANAKDVGDWLGVGPSGLFNFHPSVRTVPLEISLHGFDVYNREARLLAMSRAVYQAIKLYTGPSVTDDDSTSSSRSSNIREGTGRRVKNVIVFCSDRRHCRLTAVDLLLQAAAEDDPKRFLHVSDEVMEKYTSIVRDKMLLETLSYGVGLYHSGLSQAEQQLVQQLHASGAIQVAVVAQEAAWGLQMYAHLVVVVDTKKYTEHGYEDYTVADVLQMLGHATRPSIDRHGYAVLFCPSSKREFYKKFIFEPLPVESQLEQNLLDHVNAEIVLKTIENKQDAVDWLTWTFLYRRLAKNPNYYGLQGVSHQHLSDYLSELVESTVHTLEQTQCVSEHNDVELEPLNLGLIAAFYYVKVNTIELFNRSLTPTCKRRALLEIIAASLELSATPLRPGEEPTLRGLAQRLGVRVPQSQDINKPSTKALILLYAHFNRVPLPSDLVADQKLVLEPVVRLLHALVDVVSSNGWLVPALSSMELSQAVVQAMTVAALGASSSTQTSSLKQLPHFTDKLVAQAKEMGVEDIYDLMNMEEKRREKLLSSLTPSQLRDVAKASNRYPVINVEYQLSRVSDLSPGESIQCSIVLERDCAEETQGPVYAPYYPWPKEEQWWLVVGEAATNSLAAIKRLTLQKASTTVQLSFDAPDTPGKHPYVLYLMADSYVGGDQEYTFDLRVRGEKA